METSTDDGRSSSSSRTQSHYSENENTEISVEGPVRVEVQQDERRSRVSSQHVHETPTSSHSQQTSCLKSWCILGVKIVAFIVISLILIYGIVFFMILSKVLVLPNEALDLAVFIDNDVNPCDDFYQYSCGKFKKLYEPHIGSAYIDQFTRIYSKIQTIKRGVLEQLKEDETPMFRKAKEFYKACTDIDSINQRGVQPLKDLLVNELGGWPLTYGEWSESNFDLVTSLKNLFRLGYRPILRLETFLDSKNNNKYILKIDEPNFIIRDRNVYLADRDNTQLMAYEKLITDIATVLGLANINTAAEEVKKIVDFEIKLVDISRTLESRNEGFRMYNVKTLENLQIIYGQVIDWTRYVQSLVSLTEGKIEITNQEKILDHAPRYFLRLADVINYTPKRVIANYMIWYLVYDIAQTGLGDTIFKEQFTEYGKAVPGISTETEWKAVCADTTASLFDLAVDRIFVDRHFDKEAKTIATEMVEELKKAFSELLEESNWLDEQTKKYAEEKKQKMMTKIGYPDYIFNDTYIEEYYSGFDVGANHFENLISHSRYTMVNSLLRLRQPKNKIEWVHEATSTNAYYIINLNDIVIPAGILQKNFFHIDYPKSMNFGGIGSVIAHEIMHGFYDLGSQYDKDGNLNDWWKREAYDKFDNKSQCIIDQYGNFIWEPSKQKNNGKRTLDENIADNSGLKQAFRAYRNWVKSRGKEEEAQFGIKLTHNQLFFISFAQVWCSIRSESITKLFLNTDEHSLSDFRVLGSVQNSKDFAEAFNCPVNSKMNPSKKCDVW